jgi:hypothetical protein
VAASARLIGVLINEALGEPGIEQAQSVAEFVEAVDETPILVARPVDMVMTTRTSFGTSSAPLIRRMKSTKFSNVRRSAGDGLIETIVLSAMAIASRRSGARVLSAGVDDHGVERGAHLDQIMVERGLEEA